MVFIGEINHPRFNITGLQGTEQLKTLAAGHTVIELTMADLGWGIKVGGKVMG